MSGLSLTLVFGKYAGFYGNVTDTSARLVLGWVAFTIYWKHDIEAFMQFTVERKKELEAILNGRAS